MKTSIAYIALLIIFTIGLSSEALAQARGSVRYTIVVTEDMVGDRGSDFNSMNDADLYDKKTQPPTASVSISLMNGNQELYLAPEYLLENDIDEVYSKDVFDFIQYNQNDYPSADNLESAFLNDTGDYLVIMEFN